MPYGRVLGLQFICLTLCLQAMRVPGKAALAAMCVDESPVKSHWVPAESRTLFAPLGLSSVLRARLEWLTPVRHGASLSCLVAIPANL